MGEDWGGHPSQAGGGFAPAREAGKLLSLSEKFRILIFMVNLVTLPPGGEETTTFYDGG